MNKLKLIDDGCLEMGDKGAKRKWRFAQKLQLATHDDCAPQLNKCK